VIGDRGHDREPYGDEARDGGLWLSAAAAPRWPLRVSACDHPNHGLSQADRVVGIHVLGMGSLPQAGGVISGHESREDDASAGYTLLKLGPTFLNFRRLQLDVLSVGGSARDSRCRIG
jgi:hypothetical protein